MADAMLQPASGSVSPLPDDTRSSPDHRHLDLIQASQDALAAAHVIFSKRNKVSHKAHKAAWEHLPGGNTRTVLHASPFPLTFLSGRGSTILSLDGREYVDFLGEYTAGIYGHSNPTIRAALNKALDNGWNFGGNNLYEKELAKLVCERFSPTMELVRFTNSGTEANMLAIATAVAWTGKKKILAFESGYHGSTIGFRMPPAKRSVNLPHEWVVGKYNDVVSTANVLASLEGDSLAAIIVEPMLGSGGAIPGTLEFLSFLREAATIYGAVFIFDEVMTSRLGYRGLGHKLGIQPDLMTLGKWVGGGMSFGAFGGRREIMNMYDPVTKVLTHAGTFNNNVMSMAAGCAGMKLLDEEAMERLNNKGEKLKSKVNGLLCKYELQQSEEDVSNEFGSHSNGTNGYTNGHSKGITNGNANGHTNGTTNGHVDGQTNGHTNGHANDTANGHTNGVTNGTVNGVTNGAAKLDISSTSEDFATGITNGHSNGTYDVQPSAPRPAPMMWMSGIGSILQIHFADLPSRPPTVKAALQSLFYLNMIQEGMYMAERGFIALNIEITDEHIDKFVAATGVFVEKYKTLITAKQ
ncbi:MAG: hypothetical protein MMC33_003894 [Icmadophila ericetorum]|nr:hypothetical protein [Icmadophila ericetorum]